jgi:hypothetical protein
MLATLAAFRSLFVTAASEGRWEKANKAFFSMFALGLRLTAT